MRRRMMVPTIFAAGALAALAPPARADVRYTTQMSFGDPAAAKKDQQGPNMRTTTFVKDNNERVETSMQMGPIQMKTVSLTLKNINVGPMMPGGMSGGSMPGMRPKPKAAPGGATGKVILTYTVQDMGSEKLLNLDTRHVMVTMRTQSSGCAGNSDTTMKMEVWTAPIKVLNCPERFASHEASGDTGDGGGECKIVTETKGDVDKIKDVFSGMIVQQKFYQGDKVTMVQSLREHSLAALDPALFAVPADFRKVTEAEFAKAQQEAMQKNMMRGMQAPEEPDEKAVENDADAPEAATDAEVKKEEAPKKKQRIKIPGLPF